MKGTSLDDPSGAQTAAAAYEAGAVVPPPPAAGLRNVQIQFTVLETEGCELVADLIADLVAAETVTALVWTDTEA